MKRVLVVGGGSAGWIAAAYLNAALNRERPRVAIALVESDRIGRIGVGEATVPTIRHVIQTIGMAEADFMRACDATFKMAIRFDGWLTGAADDRYYHPFDRRGGGPVDSIGRDWLESDRSVPFARLVSAQPDLCDMGLSPRMPGSRDYASPMPYAYHMDAEKFADALRDWACARGVVHHIGTVADVVVDAGGLIEAVALDDGKRLDADLFIDCTGFAARLIGQALGTDYEDYAPWLLCDRAIAMRVPYDVHKPADAIRPYTTATALSSGWMWDIGLRDRQGRGYVYSSAFLTDDAAEDELRRIEGPHADGLEARRLAFRVGQRRAHWAGNCLAVGLSGGFIEPLESTGLYLVEYACVCLAEHFPWDVRAMPVLRDRVNVIMRQRYEEILDFVALHYCLTRRTDTAFWREVQQPARIPDRLKAKLDFWRVKPPSASDFDDHLRLFSYQSYEHILYGMDFDAHRAGSGRARQLSVPKHIAAVVEAARTRLPRHEDWLKAEVG